MSVIQLLLQAEAAEQQRAVRATAYRHRHLAPAPLIVCAYNLSGEAAAPLAIIYGTSAKKPALVVAAEPRNRESRFAAINAFSADFHKYIQPFLVTETRQGGRTGSHYEYQGAIDAPQVITPNRATRDYLGARIGRSLRYLGLGSTHPVPDETAWTGAHLSWLADHAHFPGQSVFLAATELLTQHYATGQSALEDESLGTLLAWIDNPAGGGMAAIHQAERELPFGPATDPVWESGLEPLVRQFTLAHRAGDTAGTKASEAKVERLVRPPLMAAYQATHRAVAIMRTIPQAGSVDDRWENDIREWSAYCRRASRDIPRFRKRHDPLLAARRIEIWSKALEHLDADQAFDDPLLMADLDADGQCLAGPVTRVDGTNREVKPGGVNHTLVPLITISLKSPTRLLPGQEVVWAIDRRVGGVIRSVPPVGATGESVIAVMSGHSKGANLPKVGDSHLFVTLNPFQGMSPNEPSEVPWTHRPPAPDADSGLASDLAYVDATDPSAGADDGSPDLTPDEIAALPVIGLVGPADVPAVIL